jgi:hypothetical protein
MYFTKFDQDKKNATGASRLDGFSFIIVPIIKTGKYSQINVGT